MARIVLFGDDVANSSENHMLQEEEKLKECFSIRLQKLVELLTPFGGRPKKFVKAVQRNNGQKPSTVPAKEAISQPISQLIHLLESIGGSGRGRGGCCSFVIENAKLEFAEPLVDLLNNNVLVAKFLLAGIVCEAGKGLVATDMYSAELSTGNSFDQPALKRNIGVFTVTAFSTITRPFNEYLNNSILISKCIQCLQVEAWNLPGLGVLLGLSPHLPPIRLRDVLTRIDWSPSVCVDLTVEEKAAWVDAIEVQLQAHTFFRGFISDGSLVNTTNTDYYVLFTFGFGLNSVAKRQMHMLMKRLQLSVTERACLRAFPLLDQLRQEYYSLKSKLFPTLAADALISGSDWFEVGENFEVPTSEINRLPHAHLRYLQALYLLYCEQGRFNHIPRDKWIYLTDDTTVPSTYFNSSYDARMASNAVSAVSVYKAQIGRPVTFLPSELLPLDNSSLLLSLPSHRSASTNRDGLPHSIPFFREV